MVGSDIGDINSPTNAGSRSTRVDPKLFGKPSDFSGDRREWRHFEWVFRNWFGFLYDTAEEWLDQAANSPVELGEAVPDRRETDKALYMSLAMVCKNEAVAQIGGTGMLSILSMRSSVEVIVWRCLTHVVGRKKICLMTGGFHRVEYSLHTRCSCQSLTNEAVRFVVDLKRMDPLIACSLQLANKQQVDQQKAEPNS